MASTPNDPEWLTNIKWFWTEFKELIMPALFIVFGQRWNAWRLEVKAANEEKKARAVETATTLTSLSEGITKLTNTLDQRDVHFSEQFKLTNEKIDNNHKDFKDYVAKSDQKFDHIYDTFIKPKS